MRNVLKLSFFFFFSLSQCISIAQEVTRDSLIKAMSSVEDEEEYIRLSRELLIACYYSNDSIQAHKTFDTINYIYKNIEKENLTREISIAYYSAFGPFASFKYNLLGDKLGGEKLVQKSINGLKEMQDTTALAKGYLQLGIYCRLRAAYNQSLNNYYKALELFEISDDYSGQGNIHHNIGNIFSSMKNYDQAIKQHHIAMSVRTKHELVDDMHYSWSALCGVYSKLERIDSAEFYLKKLNNETAHVDLYSRASGYSNVGIALANSGEYQKAIPYYKIALSLREELGIEDVIATSKINLGTVLMNSGDPGKTKNLCTDGYSAGKKLNDIYLLSNACTCLAQYYEEQGDLANGLKFFKLKTKYNDSLSNKEEELELTRSQLNHEFDRTRIKDSITHAKQQEITLAESEEHKAIAEKGKLELDKKRFQQYILFIGLTLLILIIAYIFYRLNVSKKQKRLIEVQKAMVEEKNKEITDSIVYAKRIQDAILPPNKTIKQHLPNSFIYYEPKDIVAGDFYWLEKKNGKVLFAAADCTGHGVPGAMVSVICNNGLNRSVREHGLVNPGKILDKTLQIVVSEFEKSVEDVKDGMDIALCSLENNVLQYAGANNPLWLIKKGSTEILEIKANKQAIGKVETPKEFSTHELKLNQGDTFYLFSDGYADQFGGDDGRPGGKKMKSANFKKFLLTIQNLSMSEQKQSISDHFKKWMGGYEQLDDVCVIGVRV